MRSVAAANAPRHGTTPAILFNDRNIPAVFFVGAIAPLTAASVTPPLLISTLGIPALTPPLAPLAFLLLRITNADLRAPIGADAKLNGRLSHHGRTDEETRTKGGDCQKSKFSHGFNSLGNRDVTSDDQGSSNPQPRRGTLPHISNRVLTFGPSLVFRNSSCFAALTGVVLRRKAGRFQSFSCM